MVPKAHRNISKCLAKYQGRSFQQMAKPGPRTFQEQEGPVLPHFPRKTSSHVHAEWCQEQHRSQRPSPAHGQTPLPAISFLGSESSPIFYGNTKRCCSLTPSHCQRAASHPPELLRKTRFPRCPKKWLNHFWVFFLGMQTEYPFGTDRNPAARQTQTNPYRNARKRSKLQAPGYKLKGGGRDTNYSQGRSCCRIKSC